MKLIHTETGKEIRLGDRVQDFRGDYLTIQSFEKGRTAESTGRVYVRSDEGWEQGFYPSVINAKIVD